MRDEFLASAVHSNTFDLPSATIFAKSTFDLGRQVGLRFREMIQSRHAADRGLDRILAWSTTLHGKSILAEFEKRHEEKYPELLDELRGLAVGAQVSYRSTLVLNLLQELTYFSNNTWTSMDSSFIQCSDFLVLNQDHALVGHNEDSSAIDRNLTYLLTVHLPSYSFVAYTYAGQLPTSAFGYGQAVAVTLNAVGPSASEVDVGIGRNFVSRALLAAHDWDDAVAMITQAGQSVGHSYNLMDIKSQAREPYLPSSFAETAFIQTC